MMPRKRVPHIFRYCPGSISGSPAWMGAERALELLRRDTALLARMVEVGSESKPSWPHTGPCSPACLRAEKPS
jgi:hypothetical protein